MSARIAAVAGVPAMLISPHLVDRLIELHQREMNDYSIRSGDLALKARSGLQSQFNVAAADLKSCRAELAGVSARIAAVRGYADKLAACDPRTKWRGTDVARHLNTILKEGTEE